MTKVSKVYLGLSRVSRDGRSRADVGRLGGRGRGDHGRVECRLGDLSTSRFVDERFVARGRGSASVSSAGLTVTAIRISRPKRRLRASSSWARSRPSSWLRVKSLGTATMAVLSWRVTGSLALSQARWLGWRSSTTPRQATSRSEVCCSTAPAFFVLVSRHRCRARAGVASRGRRVASTTLSTGCEPDSSRCGESRSETRPDPVICIVCAGQRPVDPTVSGVTRPADGLWIEGGGEPRSAANVTRFGGQRQAVIHRQSGGWLARV